jgi:hypothetical protein
MKALGIQNTGLVRCSEKWWMLAIWAGRQEKGFMTTADKNPDQKRKV